MEPGETTNGLSPVNSDGSRLSPRTGQISGLGKAKQHPSLTKKPATTSGRWKRQEKTSGPLCAAVCVTRVSWQHARPRLGLSHIQKQKRAQRRAKQGPRLPEKGSAVLSTEVTALRARRERGSGSPARQPLATRHFCNLRTGPRRKTNRAWEPAPSPAPDAR